MTLTIAIVLLVLLLMTTAIFFLLKKEVSDINNRSKIYFMRKAQEYTDKINRKEENQNTKHDENIKSKKEEEEHTQQVVYVDKKANYEIDDLFLMMKQIDQKFNVDNVSIIEEFLKNNVGNDSLQNSRYEALMKMKKLINSIGVYAIITSEDYLLLDNLVEKLRLIDEDIFMQFYSDKEEFDIQDFCDFLDYEIGNCDPTIYIYVGNPKLNYDKLNNRIRTIYSKEIYKGIKIKYLNKLYDYSLS